MSTDFGTKRTVEAGAISGLDVGEVYDLRSARKPAYGTLSLKRASEISHAVYEYRSSGIESGEAIMFREEMQRLSRMMDGIGRIEST